MLKTQYILDYIVLSCCLFNGIILINADYIIFKTFLGTDHLVILVIGGRGRGGVGVFI